MENSELIAKALHYVESESGNTSMTVESVADHAGFSTDYFNRIFAAHTGFRVMEYVRFVRLRRASLKLRTTEESILDIALSCGYDSHESFSRAFKSQYGKTPSEYRETMKAVEPLYGEYHNETVGARLVHEFPELKIGNTDDAIDLLLEKDAVKNRMIAIDMHVNGGIVLYKGNAFTDGFLVAAEINGTILIDIISEKTDLIADYFMMFNDDRYSVTVYGDIDESLLKGELKKRGIGCIELQCAKIVAYLGEGYHLPSLTNIVMRELGYDDYEIIEKFHLEKFGEMKQGVKVYLGHLKDELRARDLNGCENSTFLCGLFDGTHMIGLTLGCIQKVRGLGINNGIVTELLPRYDTEELQNYALQFVTNAAIDVGVLPFDEIQCNGDSNMFKQLTSVNFGYKVVLKSYTFR